jgi:hypothetical protein
MEKQLYQVVLIFLVKVEHILVFGDQMLNMAMTQQWN